MKATHWRIDRRVQTGREQSMIRYVYGMRGIDRKRD
jgi:hypothetical protein